VGGTVSAHEVRRIVSNPSLDPVSAARKARSAGSLSDLAEVASDRSAPARARAIAVLAAAEHCAIHGDDLPESALDAIEDPAVVAAALAADIPQALTGALAAAPDDPVTQATRKLIAATLIAARCSGPALAMLLVAVGDLGAAADALAADFFQNISDLDSFDDGATTAWIAVAGGLASERPAAFDELCARLAARSLAALDVLDELIAASPALGAAVTTDARDRIEHARLLATV
jgi:hypothetical protein